MYCNINFGKRCFFVAISVILFASCRQAPNANPVNGDDNGGYASAGSRIEWVNTDVISIADQAGLLYNGAYLRTTHNTISGCALVGVDTISAIHTLTIYFGDQDCKCLDGRYRRGTIIVQYYGRYSDTLQQHYISFSNYYVSGNNVTGSIVTTRIDTTVEGLWYYNVVENDTLNVSPDPLKSQYIIWNGTTVHRWVNGFDTPTRNDDVFSVSGTGNLTLQNGHQYSFVISAPLQYATTCDYAEAGVINVNGYNGARILNYGAGNCDAIAQMSIGVNVSNVTLNIY